MANDSPPSPDISLDNLRVLFWAIVQASKANPELDAVDIDQIKKFAPLDQLSDLDSKRPMKALTSMVTAAYPIFANRALLLFDEDALNVTLTDLGHQVGQGMGENIAVFDQYFGGAPPSTDEVEVAETSTNDEAWQNDTPEPDTFQEETLDDQGVDRAESNETDFEFDMFGNSQTETPAPTDQERYGETVNTETVTSEVESQEVEDITLRHRLIEQVEDQQRDPAPTSANSGVDLFDLLGGGKQNPLDANTPEGDVTKRRRRLNPTPPAPAKANDQPQTKPEPTQTDDVALGRNEQGTQKTGGRTGFTSRLLQNTDAKQPPKTSGSPPDQGYKRTTIGDAARGSNDAPEKRGRQAQPSAGNENKPETGARRRLATETPDLAPRGPRSAGTPNASQPTKQTPKQTTKRVPFPDGRLIEFDEDILNRLIAEHGTLTAVIEWYMTHEDDTDGR